MVEKFVCDEMLQGVGRWLRAAGYDTLIASNSEHDARLLQRARDEGRWLVTRDRQLSIEHPKDRDIIVLLQSNHVPACLEELTRRCAINWCKAPFSRCLLCNEPLRQLGEETRALLKRPVPEDVGSTNQTLWYCPACRKAYWEGSHVRRMRAKLRHYNEGVWR